MQSSLLMCTNRYKIQLLAVMKSDWFVLNVTISFQVTFQAFFLFRGLPIPTLSVCCFTRQTCEIYHLIMLNFSSVLSGAMEGTMAQESLSR